nr:hypothetical protein [Gammaproteobacteria bacterium]
LDSVRKEFRIRPENVFFIDDDSSHKHDLQKLNDDTKKFKFIFANKLELLQGPLYVVERAVETRRLLKELQDKAIKCIRESEVLEHFLWRTAKLYPSLYGLPQPNEYKKGCFNFSL